MARFAVAPAHCWHTDPVRAELDLRVVACTGAAGDVRSQMEVVKLIATGGLLCKSRCTLVYCAFRTQADQVRSCRCSRTMQRRRRAAHQQRMHV